MEKQKPELCVKQKPELCVKPKLELCIAEVCVLYRTLKNSKPVNVVDEYIINDIMSKIETYMDEE